MKRALLVGLALAGLAASSVTVPALAAEHGITMGDKAPGKLHVMKNEPSDIAASKLIGLDVYNKANESVGEIKDLVMKDGRTLDGVVVSVGGFLGAGESYVLIDPASIVVSNKDGKLKALVDTTKAELQKEPQFKYSDKQKS